MAPVGSFSPNPFGLYDMSGNALEHVFDEYDANFYQISLRENPIGPGPAMPIIWPTRAFGYTTVARGGSAHRAFQFCRSSFRTAVVQQPGTTTFDGGFRVARSLN